MMEAALAWNREMESAFAWLCVGTSRNSVCHFLADLSSLVSRPSDSPYSPTEHRQSSCDAFLQCCQGMLLALAADLRGIIQSVSHRLIFELGFPAQHSSVAFSASYASVWRLRLDCRLLPTPVSHSTNSSYCVASWLHGRPSLECFPHSESPFFRSRVGCSWVAAPA